MCGRFGIDYILPGLAEYFRFDPNSVADEYSASLNVAPGSDILAVKASGTGSHQRVAGMMRWGLIPHWARELDRRARPMFNARGETVDVKPMFRVPFARRRCLVPASGFYEWTSDGSGGRVPVWIHGRDSSIPIAFAGIWNRWVGPDFAIESCSIITTAPNGLMSPIHDRMPVILRNDDFDAWLDPEAESALIKQMLVPREWDDMVAEAANPRLLMPRTRAASKGRPPTRRRLT